MSELWTPSGMSKTAGAGEDAVFKALSRGRAGAVDDPLAEQMKHNRRVNGRRTASQQAEVTLASGRPVDPMFYWKNNNLPYDINKPGELMKIRAYCRLLYLTHPVIASAIDVYSKYPLTGMELVCFAGETEVITRAGTKPIRDLAGGMHTLLTTGGKWVTAPVQAMGQQKLVALTVTRNQRTKVIYTTANHRWFVQEMTGPGRAAKGEQNRRAKVAWEQVEEIRAVYAAGGASQIALAGQYGLSQSMVSQIVRGTRWQESGRDVAVLERETPTIREVVTNDLQPGDRLESVFAKTAIHSTHPSPFGIAHGVTYGDGALATSGGGAFVELYGAKDAALLRYFQGCRMYDFTPDAESEVRQRAAVASVRVANLPAYFKTLPPLTEGTSYLYGFLAGWFAADGTVSIDGKGAYLDSVNEQALLYARNLCHLLGIKTTAPYRTVYDARLPQGTVKEGHVSYRLSIDVDSLTEAFFATEEHCRRWLARGEKTRRENWVVVSVEETDRVEEVYCAVVPGTEAFALEDNILTGNCKDEQLTDFYTTLFFEQLGYEDYLPEIGREYWTVGEAWPLGSFNETLGVWEDDELINPDDVDVIRSPFLKEPRFQMRLPESLRMIIESRSPKWEYEALMRSYPELRNFMGDQARMPVSNVLLKQLRFKADTFHPRGIPILMRGFRAVMQEEMLNAAQDAVASRLYTPLILAKLGASATDLGTQNPWIPNEEDMSDFAEALDAALAGDFRVLIHHFATSMESVFGRENMPQMDADFDRLTDRQLQVFGLSRTMLTGADGNETYASDAINRDLISQLLTNYQRLMKQFFRSRALVVAEAQEHFDYEERNGKRYPIMEEVLEVDEESGEQRIVEQPKLLVPELHIKAMTMKDEQQQRDFYEALRATGVPISMKSRLVNVPLDLNDEVDRTRQETIDLAVAAQETRKQTYLALRSAGLPVPDDLKKDFEPVAQGAADNAASAPTAQVILQSGMVDPGTQALAPTPGEIAAAQKAGELPETGVGVPAAPAGPGGQVIPLTRNKALQPSSRPPESDEMRASMPKPASLIIEKEGKRVVEVQNQAVYNEDGSVKEAAHWIDVEVDQEGPQSLMSDPRHLGMRRHAAARFRKDADGNYLPLDEQTG